VNLTREPARRIKLSPGRAEEAGSSDRADEYDALCVFLSHVIIFAT
jgi:hypothetical protein